MSAQHQELAAGRWSRLTFLEQMANIGSDVERALSWRRKRRPAVAQRAAERALELIDLTLAGVGNPVRLRELARVREALVDDLFGENQHRSTDGAWSKYFLAFTYAARKDR